MMKKAELIIRCPSCGREEQHVRMVDDRVVEFNLDKPCPACQWVWMTDKRLTMTENP